jgi:hypothetical protein
MICFGFNIRGSKINFRYTRGALISQLTWAALYDGVGYVAIVVLWTFDNK